MKLRLTIIVLFILAFQKASFSQQNQENPQLFAAISGYTCEYLLRRLDGFIAEIGKKPASVGYVVIYANKDSIENMFLERFMEKYRTASRIDKNRFVILTSSAKKDRRFEFWLSEDSAKKPDVAEERFSLALPPTGKPVLFVRSTVEVAKIDGKWMYVESDCADCCIETVALDYLDVFLKANPQLNAEIRLYALTRNYTDKLDSLIREEMVIERKISSNRFRILYKGVDEVTAKLPENMATVEIEFIPQQ